MTTPERLHALWQDAVDRSRCLCRLGPDPDKDAVMDGNAGVHGFSNLFVADASVMPTIPQANTHTCPSSQSQRRSPRGWSGG
jgi:hypothetical protein